MLVAGDEFVGLHRAVFDRIGAGNSEGVKAVQIATCGQDLGGAHDVAPRCWAYVASVHGGDQAIELAVHHHQAVGISQLVKQRCMGILSSQATLRQGLGRRGT